MSLLFQSKVTMNFIRRLFCIFTTLSVTLAVTLAAHTEHIALDERYALEVEDPYHRHISLLLPAHTIWQQAWRTIHPEFWTFLEREQNRLQSDTPALYDPSYHMLWLDREQRAAYKITLQQAAHDKTIFVHTPHSLLADGKWMYIALNSDFYVARERKHQVHHISLSGGEHVTMAGTMKVKNGQLATISFISGHYRPTILQAINFLHCLDKQGLDFSGIKMSYCIVKGQMTIKQTVSLEEFLNLDTNPSADQEIELETQPFMMPYEEFLVALPQMKINKAELFLTEEGRLYAASRKIPSAHPSCAFLGSCARKASIKLTGTQIHKIMFPTHIDQIGEIEHIKRFVEHLILHDIDVDKINFRVIEHHEKVMVSAQDILNA